MKQSSRSSRLLIAIGVMSGISGYAVAQDFVQIEGAACATPPVLHCPDKECTGDRVINQGPVVEMKTRRTFFLDYPCDLKPGEKVTFVLSLHGGGSYGNWQRHYFPIMDFKEKYRLVIATPNSPTRRWTDADDAYLHNIVSMVYDSFGKKNVEVAGFWLAGHSQGGMTSHRLVCTDFFKDKVDGMLILSGGRIGRTGPPPDSFFPGGVRPANFPGASSGGAAAAQTLPACDFSHIYTTGEHELSAPIPETSPWAAKYGCGARVRREDVVDEKAGYVYDSTRQNPGTKAWGLLPRGGKAEVFEFPDCKDDRIVADVVRIDKGHTEGLEPNVTEQLIKLILSAKN
ncbi:MAG: hypothetical protein ACREV5_09255 [Steroidobacter sp.]